MHFLQAHHTARFCSHEIQKTSLTRIGPVSLSAKVELSVHRVNRFLMFQITKLRPTANILIMSNHDLNSLCICCTVPQNRATRFWYFILCTGIYRCLQQSGVYGTICLNCWNLPYFWTNFESILTSTWFIIMWCYVVFSVQNTLEQQTLIRRYKNWL